MSCVEMCESQAVLEEIGGFRYRVYVEELGKTAIHADHRARLLIEPIDATSDILFVRGNDGEISGSLRLTHGKAVVIAQWPESVRDRLARCLPSECSFASRLMVEPKRRGANTTLLLFKSGFQIALQRGSRYCQVNCVPGLVNFFTRWGFDRVGDNYVDSWVGPQAPLLLFLYDYDRFKSLRSPFLSVLEEHVASGGGVAAFCG